MQVVNRKHMSGNAKYIKTWTQWQAMFNKSMYCYTRYGYENWDDQCWNAGVNGAAEIEGWLSNDVDSLEHDINEGATDDNLEPGRSYYAPQKGNGLILEDWLTGKKYNFHIRNIAKELAAMDDGKQVVFF